MENSLSAPSVRGDVGTTLPTIGQLAFVAFQYIGVPCLLIGFVLGFLIGWWVS
jgi:hypothetical protein